MAEIDTLRGEIDDITIQMIKLLKKRTSVSRQIGTIKGSSGKNVLDEEREEQLRTLVLKACSEIELDDSMGTRLLNFLLNESVKVQSDSIPQSSHLAIFAKAKEMEKNGTEIIHMEVGEPDFSPPSKIAHMLSEACENGRVKYGTTQGDAEFREKISKHASLMYDVEVSPKDVLVTAGARFAIYLAMQTLLEQGDEVIIIEPAWPAYSQCAINVGAKARIVRTTIENRWEPSLQDIKSKINSNTKMIILNYPNNPTGKILGDDLLDSIINVAKENNLYVLSDEIYSQYAYHMPYKSVASYKYERSIVAQSFSKSHAMTGFRIGYALADKSIVKKMSKLQALCMTSVCDPVQYAAMRVLDEDVSENTRIIQKRLDALCKVLKETQLESVVPDGAMYVFCHLPDGLDGTVLAQKLLEHGVAVAPGEAFGQYRDYIRISACADIGQLNKGIKVISSVVNS